MIDDVLLVEGASGARRVQLSHYLEPAADHAALEAEYHWIKQLRLLEVDGQPFRRRFTMRGDSLWWFAELYLHKRQVVLNLFQTISALESLCTKEQPRTIRIERGAPVVRHLVTQIASARNIRYDGGGVPALDAVRLLRTDMRARALMIAARMSRVRPSIESTGRSPARVAAFVHRAFWRSRERDGSAESYIGPVLAALEDRVSTGMEYVGVGPTSNFRARRWWRVAATAYDRGPATPIEAFAPLSTLSDSSRIWRERYHTRRLLLGSDPLRAHARLGGVDCWPIIREELAGIAFLQWPWSARAMDEAGAALDALRPEVVVTYAEAGGWGRALMLEARRRGIPTIGLQHGFIYHSWLNYLHEEDEMRPDPANPSDRGFPRPTKTLVFDDYARSHLERCGRFPPESLVVTGSPRLDALVRSVGGLSNAEVASALEASGAGTSRALVLFVAKYSQAKHVLGALADAVARMPDVQLAIKAHPAETPEAYAPIARGRHNIRILPAAAPLGPLLRASRVVITVNSTVALDAGVLGIPALVIGLPNNLSPFVTAGVMAGAATPADIEPALRRILYDQEFRLQIERSRDEYLRRYAIASDGRAAQRSAEAALALADGAA
jgi:Capsule polysaccharide biosynthesis protein